VRCDEVMSERCRVLDVTGPSIPSPIFTSTDRSLVSNIGDLERLSVHPINSSKSVRSWLTTINN
jgi:hypothetical protein